MWVEAPNSGMILPNLFPCFGPRWAKQLRRWALGSIGSIIITTQCLYVLIRIAVTAIRVLPGVCGADIAMLDTLCSGGLVWNRRFMVPVFLPDTFRGLIHIALISVGSTNNISAARYPAREIPFDTPFAVINSTIENVEPPCVDIQTE